MGLCSSQDEAAVAEKKRSKNLQKTLDLQKRAEDQVHKLLLLGAGESGKSTLFKQMVTIYGDGFPEHERLTYVNVIRQMCIGSMKTLLVKVTKPWSNEASAAAAAVMEDAKSSSHDLTPTLAEHIATLWKDEAVKEAYARRSTYQLSDSAAYFLDQVTTIGAEGYIPTEQDVLRSRVRTTGITEETFQINNNRVRIMDVGGQRSERKKWIHCFEDVTALLFVAAISSYDQTLFEDGETNRMHEALTVFESVVESEFFQRTPIILFLNKKDIFQDKIQQVSLRVCFPDYEGPDGDYDQAVEFIEDQFFEKTQRRIYSHVTCATDTNNARHVFTAVADIVITNEIRDVGLA